MGEGYDGGRETPVGGRGASGEEGAAGADEGLEVREGHPAAAAARLHRPLHRQQLELPQTPATAAAAAAGG